MSVVELALVAVGLSMDAFAVAICKGLGMARLNLRQAALIAVFFGGFQALMPIAGYVLGAQFAGLIEPIYHWVAFALLAFIGGKMLVDVLAGVPEGASPCEACGDASPGEPGVAVASGNAVEQLVRAPGASGAPGVPRDTGDTCVPLDVRGLFMLAVATSIDALAVGITLAFLQVDIVFAASFIGCVTFALVFAGVVVGHQFGSRWERPSTIAGGVVLILIGTKILLEHLGILVL